MKTLITEAGPSYSSLHSMQAVFKTLFMIYNIVIVLLLLTVYMLGYYNGKDSIDRIKRQKQKEEQDGLPRIPADQVHRFSNSSN